MPASSHATEYDPNAPAALTAAIHINVISAAMLLIQPAFVQALVDRAAVSAAAAGAVAGTEMLGVAIGAMLVALASSQVGWRGSALLALSLMVIGTLASAWVPPAALGGARFIVGIGAGWIMSLSFEAVGRSRQPDRSFAWLVTAALSFGAAVVFALPALLDAVGLKGFLLLLAGYYATGFLVVMRLPPAAQPAALPQTDHAVRAVPSPMFMLSAPLRWLAIAAMFCYYVAQGAVWAYLALMGSARGLDDSAVAAGLTISQLAGLGAVLAAGALANRVTRSIALGIGIVGAGIVLWLLLGPQTALLYGVLVCAFNAAWNWTDPFLLGTMSAVDSSGRVMVWAVAWRLLGLAIGPFAAAQLLDGTDYSRVNALGILALAGALACLLAPLRGLRRSGR
jgi:predicted MFS family arabinose efflux permease